MRLLVVGCLKCVAERGCGAGLGVEAAMFCNSDVLITGLNVCASALDQSL